MKIENRKVASIGAPNIDQEALIYFAEKIQELEKLVENEPNNDAILTELGFHYYMAAKEMKSKEYFKQKEYPDKAKETLCKALEINENNGDAWGIRRTLV